MFKVASDLNLSHEQEADNPVKLSNQQRTYNGKANTKTSHAFAATTEERRLGENPIVAAATPARTSVSSSQSIRSKHISKTT